MENFFFIVASVAAAFQFFYMLYSYCIIIQSWNIEANPWSGGWRSSLSVFHWNLNCIWVEDFSKLPQIAAFLDVLKFDIYCLIETFVDFSISSEGPRLTIEGCKLFRCDHPSNLRRGGVSLYFKDHLLVTIRTNLTTLDGCLVCEIQNGSNSSVSFKVSSNFLCSNKGGRKQSLILMIALLPLQCILEILNSRNSEL